MQHTHVIGFNQLKSLPVLDSGKAIAIIMFALVKISVE